MRKLDLDFTAIEKEIREAIHILALDRMPTSKEIRMLGMNSLENKILQTDGYTAWANRLGLEMKKPTNPIDDKDIPNLVLSIVAKLDEWRMPSRSEIVQHLDKGEGLHNKICKSGGYRFWADKLQLDIKDSETKTGQNYEELLIDLLISKGYHVERMSTKHPFDLLVNSTVRIDVKAGHAYDLRGSRCHTFALNKRNASCDIYIALALSEKGEIERTLIIPSHHLKLVTLSIGENSKYNRYISKWEYIDEYSNFYKSII